MNREMLKKMRNAKSVEEVIAIAKEYGQEITEEKAGELLDRLNDAGGGLPDDALEAVAGGLEWGGLGMPRKMDPTRPLSEQIVYDPGYVSRSENA